MGKGFMTMEVSHELVDPKVMVNSTQNGHPSGCSSVSLRGIAGSFGHFDKGPL